MTTHYQPKDPTCSNCGAALSTHVQYRDAKPPRCTAKSTPEQRRWYVHVKVAGGIWSSGGPKTRADADAEAAQLRASGKTVDITPDHERRGL